MLDALTPPVQSARARICVELWKFRVLHSNSLNDMGLLQLFQSFVAKRKGAKRLAVGFSWEREMSCWRVERFLTSLALRLFFFFHYWVLF